MSPRTHQLLVVPKSMPMMDDIEREGRELPNTTELPRDRRTVRSIAAKQVVLCLRGKTVTAYE